MVVKVGAIQIEQFGLVKTYNHTLSDMKFGFPQTLKISMSFSFEFSQLYKITYKCSWGSTDCQNIMTYENYIAV